MTDDRNTETAGDALPMFPILWGYDLKDRIRELQAAGVPYLPICLPREMLDPHEAQAQKNHGQSIKRLAERGGLAPGEALAILDDRRYRPMPLALSTTELCRRIAEWVDREAADAERAKA